MIVWEVVVWAVILLVVAVILIFVFKNLLGEEQSAINDTITGTKDSDRDLVPDAFEAKGCENTPPGEKVNSRGCSSSQPN